MLFSNFKDNTSLRVTMQQAISTTFYRIKKEEEENHRNKKEITTKFDEEPEKQKTSATCNQTHVIQ